MKVQLLLVLVLTVTSPVLVTSLEKVIVKGMVTPALYLPDALLVVTDKMVGLTKSPVVKFQSELLLIPTYWFNALSTNAVLSI